VRKNTQTGQVSVTHQSKIKNKQGLKRKVKLKVFASIQHVQISYGNGIAINSAASIDRLLDHTEKYDTIKIQINNVKTIVL
jgi:phosphotransferase system IIB component